MHVELITVVAALSIIILVIGTGAARRGGSWGLTLLRVVGIGVLIVSVAWMVFAIFSSTTICIRPNKTRAIHRAVMAGLENYRSEFGEYPQPVRRGRTIQLDGQAYEADASLMLYQVMTGDGNDAILRTNNDKPSDGRVEGDELKKVFLTDMPREMSKLTEAGYIIVDAYGHPFQYEAFAAGSVDVVNSTYDLWSFAESPLVKATEAAKRDASLSARWVKNW